MKKIKENLLQIVTTSVVILLPIIAGIILWDKLPDMMASHFGPDGSADQYSPKGFVVFAIPSIILLMHLLCIAITSFDNKHKKDIGEKTYRLILWICPLCSIFMGVLMYTKSAFNMDIDVPFAAILFAGLIILIIGNYIPKTRQNHIVGVRIKWTLESKVNWHKTNRFSGYMMCIIGLLLILVALGRLYAKINSYVLICVLIGTILVFVIVTTLYSYNYYKKHKDDADYYDSKE